MEFKDMKFEFQRGSKVVITLNFDDKKELIKYIVKRQKRLDEFI